MKCIIFDVDGLLVNTEPIHYDSWMGILKRFGLLTSKEEYGALFVGTSDIYVAEWIVAKGHSVNPKELVKEKTALFWELCINARPMPEIVDLLNALKGNLLMGVASSSNINIVMRMLDSAGLNGFFNFFAGGDEVGQLKPAPDIYLLAAHRAGVQPVDCMAVEDSSSGVSSAVSAGMTAIAIPSKWTSNQDFSKAKYVIAKPSVIPSLIGMKA